MTKAPVVAIVGGGFTGAAIAFHLARGLGSQPLTVAPRIVVIEPRATLGAGLAHSTPEPAHRINVPASKMSLVSEDPGYFARWLGGAGVLPDDPAAVTDKDDHRRLKTGPPWTDSTRRSGCCCRRTRRWR